MSDNRNLEIVNRFMSGTSTGGNLDDAVSVLSDSFKHLSPVDPGGCIEGKNTFKDHMTQIHASMSFRSERLTEMVDGESVVIRYDAYVGDAPPMRIIEFFTVKEQKIDLAEAYFLSFPPAPPQ